MHCHVCNVAVGDGQRFCHECGESLGGVTDPTAVHGVVGTDDERPGDRSTTDADPDPEFDGLEFQDPELNDPELTDPESAEPEFDDEVTAETAVIASEPTDDDLPRTEPVDVVATSSAIQSDDALPATEALAAATAPRIVRSNDLASVPYEPMDEAAMGDAPAVDAPFAYDATTTMPLTGAPSTSGLDITDEVAEQGPRGVGSTAEMLVTQPGGLFDGGADADAVAPPAEGFRLRASFVFALLALGATLMAAVADVIDIRTSRPVDGIIVGIRSLEDVASNLAVAGYVGAALMLIGGALACFGVRWGSGLAGGAGLSLTGWAAVTLGLVETPIHAAEGVTANANEVTAFTLSITRDLGYFLILSVGVLGLIAFLVSLRLAGRGGRGGLNPWIAAVGALSSVVLAAGPLITLGGAPLDANLGTVGVPKEFFAGRLVQLGLLVVTGVIGFLSVRTYGLGLAAGGLGVATWMWITALADIGDLPVSVAIGNLGTLDTTPHAVTTVGVTASLALLLIAATVAIATRNRA